MNLDQNNVSSQIECCGPCVESFIKPITIKYFYNRTQTTSSVERYFAMSRRRRMAKMQPDS